MLSEKFGPPGGCPSFWITSEWWLLNICCSCFAASFQTFNFCFLSLEIAILIYSFKYKWSELKQNPWVNVKPLSVSMPDVQPLVLTLAWVASKVVYCATTGSWAWTNLCSLNLGNTVRLQTGFRFFAASESAEGQYEIWRWFTTALKRPDCMRQSGQVQ